MGERRRPLDRLRQIAGSPEGLIRLSEALSHTAVNNVLLPPMLDLHSTSSAEFTGGIEDPADTSGAGFTSGIEGTTGAPNDDIFNWAEDDYYKKQDESEIVKS